MTVATHPQNADQAASWNGTMGQSWVARQEFMDAMLEPVSEVLFDSIRLEPGMRVLDIGCGSGSTTLRIAAQVSPGGHATGLDISAPLLARARQRAPAGAAVTFIEGDAMLHAFDPDADLLFSRFGVMFFADPVAAFTNMRRGLRPGARVLFACWRAARANQRITVPMDAVRGLLPPQPPADPNAAGPYSFADDQRVLAILKSAGFRDATVSPVDLMLDVAVGGGIEAAVTSAFEIGPSAWALADQPAEIRAAAAAAMREAFAPFERGGRVDLGAAIWLVRATNP